MTLLELFALIVEDYHAHSRNWTKPGFRAMAVYRFGVWRMGIRSKLIRAPFSVLYGILFRRCRNIYGIEIPYSCTIGRRVIIEHQGGIVLHGQTVVGDGSIIRQNCTFGIRSLGALHEAPVLGRGVDVGAGAVLLGAIHVGDGAVIGANAVVLQDVPAGYLAVGVPAVVKPRRAPEVVYLAPVLPIAAN